MMSRVCSGTRKGRLSVGSECGGLKLNHAGADRVAALSPRAFGLGPLPAAVVSGPPEPEVRGFVPGTPIPTSGIPGPKSRDSGRENPEVRKPKTDSHCKLNDMHVSSHKKLHKLSWRVPAMFAQSTSKG